MVLVLTTLERVVIERVLGSHHHHQVPSMQARTVDTFLSILAIGYEEVTSGCEEVDVTDSDRVIGLAEDPAKGSAPAIGSAELAVMHLLTRRHASRSSY